MELKEKLEQLVKYDALSINSAYDNYCVYDKVVLLEDLLDILEEEEEE